MASNLLAIAINEVAAEIGLSFPKCVELWHIAGVPSVWIVEEPQT